MGPFGLVGVSTTSLEGAHLVVVDLVVHLVAQRVGNFSDRPWGISVILVSLVTPGIAVIEIGSGCGDLAHYLGITATDNCMQKWREIKRHYRLVGQPTIKYPDFVQSLDAIEAIDQYKPEVVVASWVTQWIDPDQPPPPGGGNIWGVKEDEILKRKCVYIFIGNHAVHGSKKIMSILHKEYKLPFLRSRANQPELDRVWIWNER